MEEAAPVRSSGLFVAAVAPPFIRDDRAHPDRSVTKRGVLAR
jgi:hypothetical protein